MQRDGVVGELDKPVAEALDAQMINTEVEQPTQGSNPSSVFEEEPTTQKDATVQPTKHTGIFGRPWLIVLVFVCIACAAVGTYVILRVVQSSVKDTSTSNSATTQSITVPTATSQDTEIQTALDTVDASISQTTDEQAQADSALSDSDQQITVPTE